MSYASTIASVATVPPAVCPPSAAAQPASQSSGQSTGLSLWSHGGLSGFFKDILDTINPLQHLPVIGSIYRYLTGDEPSGGARIVGDALYGGPIGFGVGVVSTLLTDQDGRDVGERVLAGVFGPSGHEPSNNNTAVAAATPAPAPDPALAQPQTQTQARAQAAPIPLAPGLAQPTSQTELAATLYRSPPALAAPAASPEQNFVAQNAQFQRQLANSRPASGQVLNSRPVPLELSGNLLPLTRPAPSPVSKPAVQPQAPSLSAPQSAPGNATATPSANGAANPIAQKMLDALDKYERMKKQQKQGDNAKSAGVPKVDLTL